MHNFSDLRSHHNSLLSGSKDVHSLEDSGYIFISFLINVFIVRMQKYCQGIAFGSAREHWEWVYCMTWQEPNGFERSAAHSMCRRERN
jgi:hypothetical protein